MYYYFAGKFIALFTIGPRRLANSINTDSSRTQSSLNPESNTKTSLYDSMATNALSDRSTLNDEDLLPGSSLIKILQHSYKLVNERSENISEESQTRLISKVYHGMKFTTNQIQYIK